VFHLYEAFVFVSKVQTSCFLSHVNRCIRGALKDKIVILVTHQVHFALQGDKLLVLKDVSSIWGCGSRHCLLW
jgi:ABC-type transport system involved in cytochrome bd biosynthesis fused ATPase/permease subunit